MRILQFVLIGALFMAFACGKGAKNPIGSNPPSITPPGNGSGGNGGGNGGTTPPPPVPLWETTTGDKFRNVWVVPSGEVVVKGVNEALNVEVFARFNSDGTLANRSLSPARYTGARVWPIRGGFMGDNGNLYSVRRELPERSNTVYNFIQQNAPVDGTSIAPFPIEVANVSQVDDLAWANNSGSIVATASASLHFFSPTGILQRMFTASELGLEYAFIVSFAASPNGDGFYLVGMTGTSLYPPGFQGEEDGYATRRDGNGNFVWGIQLGDASTDYGDEADVSPDGQILYVSGRTGSKNGTTDPQFGRIWKVGTTRGDLVGTIDIRGTEGIRATVVNSSGTYVLTRNDFRKVEGGSWTRSVNAGAFGSIAIAPNGVWVVADDHRVYRFDP